MDGHLDQFDTMDTRLFMIAVRRLADSFNYGTDRSPFLGSGVEYVQSRPYQFGDSIKAIDWRVTARTGRPYVKEYEAPKSLPCYLFLDTSASMTVSSTRRSKYATALHIAGGVAFACLDRVSPVGIVATGDHEIRIEPSLSRNQIMQWLARFRRYRYDESTSLGRRIAEVTPGLRNRCLVIVLSDLHDPRAVPALKRMAQLHDVVVLQLRDPAEHHTKGSGFLRAREAETGHEFVTHGRRRWLEPEVVAQQLKRAGIDHLVVPTDQPFAHRVRHFFESRGVLSRGAR